VEKRRSIHGVFRYRIGHDHIDLRRRRPKREPGFHVALAQENPSDRLVRDHLIAALAWLVFGMLAGFTLAYRLMSPENAEFLGDLAPLSYGRMRMFHTHAVIFGWLTNGFIAFTYYAVPRLVNKPLFGLPLARFNFPWTQVAILIGALALLFGHAEGVEYAEAPWWADILFASAFVFALLNALGTVLQARDLKLYVSVWYIILGFTFTALNFVMANTIAAHVAPGAAGAAITGLWIHNAVGLWVTPMGVAIAYYLLPVLVDRPIANHRLSVLGFWTLAILYPLGGSHHYFYSPVPWWLQVMAVPLTSALIFVVYTVVYNFFATMKGQWRLISGNLPLRFLAFGIFSYIITCTQGPFHALFSVQRVVHFTDWVVAHAHLALFGVFSWWLFAFIYFAWPRLTGRELRSKAAGEWHFWLTFLGFFILYYIPDTIAGLMQGFAWLRGLPFNDSFVAAQPFWIPRAVSGVVLLAGVLLMIWNLTAPPRKTA
jgi:cbb3-type cytochrome c oxidase subunit I